jgi:hypothetical protein
MNKSLFLIFALSATLATSVQSSNDAKKRLSILTNVLTNPNLQNNINNGLNAINSFVNNLASTTVVPRIEPPSSLMQRNMSQQVDMDLLIEWATINIQFVLNKTDLDATTKGVLLSIIPKLLNAKTQEEIQAILDPVLLTGIGFFFQDPYIIFNKHPYLEATKRILKMFFASPDAPDFLKDPAQQAMILAYVDKLFATNDPSTALAMLSMDL